MTWRESKSVPSSPPSAGSTRSQPGEVIALAAIVQASKDSPVRTGVLPEDNATDAHAHLVDPADLIGAAEVMAICGWKTRKSIGDHARHGFPPAVASVSGARIWTRTEVQQWHDTHNTPPA